MNNSLISHIGIAVTDFDEAVMKYKLLLNDDHPEICTVADQKVKVAVFHNQNNQKSLNNGKIELLTPLSTDSPVAKFIDKRGEGLHHVCIYVIDIKKKLTELKQAGFKLIDETPRYGVEGNLIAFVHPSGMKGVLIELEEKAK